MKLLPFKTWISITGGVLVLVALGLGINQAAAANREVQDAAISPIHPEFSMLDSDGNNVLDSGLPVSTMKTCGACHDTEFIASHSYHSDLGLSEVQSANPVTGESWDASSGPFGHWDPLGYRYLSQPGDEFLDLGTPEWVMTYGLQHIGGGPAYLSRTGQALTSLPAQASNPETAAINPQLGRAVIWDWEESGIIEMNCFLCHIPSPNTSARQEAIGEGLFGWANTATLSGTGIVIKDGSGNYLWNPEAFDENGELLEENITIQAPTNDNCSTCHGLVHGSETPLVLTGCSLEYSQTARTGQVIAAAMISDSGMNLSDKNSLARSWDVHAARQLQCVDCHYSLNNPVYYRESDSTRPDTLIFDPRRIDLGDYLERPDHDFARGQSAQSNLAPELKGSMRRCESCHHSRNIHADWLPYTDAHLSAISCESCHIPQMYAPAIESYDWTVISIEGEPKSVCRGVEGDPDTLYSLVSGFTPTLLPRRNIDGQQVLAPYNLVTTWFWIYDDANGNTRPVRLIDLETVYLKNGHYRAEIVKEFDADGDGQVSELELTLDTSAKQELIAARLVGLGLGNPRIQGLVQPYSINHGVAGSGFAISDCRACHHEASRITQPVRLAVSVPGGVLPAFAEDTNISANGNLSMDESGALFYTLDPITEGLYIFGNSNTAWVDWVGGLSFLGVLVAITVHGALRYLQARKSRKSQRRLTHRNTRKLYLYEAYERFWHWLQTVLIVILLVTGLFIHRPDLFGISFRGLVVIHNVSAAILAINAFLSLFYHLASGKVRQFLPHPYGFFDDAIRQTKFYLRGIFKDEPHPFEKSPEKKMNPLQQVTYLGILNVLLPLQGLTGILIWGAQRWPEAAGLVGGLAGLAGYHTLLAWLFAAFIAAHVYLTTTGGTGPFDSIKAMITGWEVTGEKTVRDISEPQGKKKK